MTKEFKFNITDWLGTYYFSPIREKIDVIRILMKITSYILIYDSIEDPAIGSDESKFRILLRVDKMSRIFFCSPNKIYSIYFPFMISKNNEKINFYFNGIEITSEVISRITEVFKADFCGAQLFSDFAESIFDVDDQSDCQFWFIIKKLLTMEDGYIRLDCDPNTFNCFSSRGEGRRHPLNHYDVFYSQSNTFKIGVENNFDIDNIIDLLDPSTECKFLK